MTTTDKTRGFSNGEYQLKINDQLVQTKCRAIVVIDAKSFSVTSNQIQEKVGTPEVVLIYQMVIRRRIEECITEAVATNISIEYHFTGGDAAILLFKDVIDAHDFLRILNARHKTSSQLLFSAGATYGSVAYYTKEQPIDPNNEASGATPTRVQIVDIAGFPISLGARLQSSSQAGRVVFDSAFHDEFLKSPKLSDKDKKDQEKFVAQKPVTMKNTHFEKTYSFDYITDKKLTSDAGSITLTTGTRFVLSDWSTLWKLLMGGDVFLTMNRLKPENWMDKKTMEDRAQSTEPSENDINKERRVQVRHMGSINDIYPKFDNDTINEIFPDWLKQEDPVSRQVIQRCCRLFIYENEDDAKKLEIVFKYHNDNRIGCRKIWIEDFKKLIENKKSTFPGAFSVSQIDGVWFIANYEYDPVSREITYINIPKLEPEEIRDYLNLYFEIYLKATAV